jgi:hypothetical protein
MASIISSFIAKNSNIDLSLVMSYGSEAIGLNTARLLEHSSDELARLDATASLAPHSFGLAFRLDALDPREEGTRGAVRSLVAASVEPLHDGTLDRALRSHRDFVADEERRVRAGGALTSARIVAAGYHVADPESLDSALRPGGRPRPALIRAVAAAAAIHRDEAFAAALQDGRAGEGTSTRARAPSTDEGLPMLPRPPVLGSAVAALLLCGAGVTDQLRLLPFAGVDPAALAYAFDAWGQGDRDPWTTAALSEASRAARARRVALVRELDARDEQDARLDALGRAAITARRALIVLRDELATTVPALAARLDCSRPAAGDALERLVAAELATEITARARDRVFAHTAALDAALDAAGAR